MSYLRYWKLNRSPFQWADPVRDFFAGGSVEEALARAEFLVENNRRLGVVVGPSGVGKTCLLDHFANRRSLAGTEMVHAVDLKYADAAGVAQRIRAELYNDELSGVGIEKTNAARLWREIDDALAARNAVGQRSLFLFDNTGYATEEGIDTLAVLLTNRTSWSALLCVDEQLLVDLPRRILESCELRIDLPPWDLGQTADFFEVITDRCGKRDDLYTAQAITRIQELSDGIPRRIVQLADLALVAGAVRRAKCIDAELVDQVFDEFAVNLGAKFHALWQS